MDFNACFVCDNTIIEITRPQSLQLECNASAGDRNETAQIRRLKTSRWPPPSMMKSSQCLSQAAASDVLRDHRHQAKQRLNAHYAHPAIPPPETGQNNVLGNTASRKHLEKDPLVKSSWLFTALVAKKWL